VLNAKACVVTFQDSEGIQHSVQVAAESLYEAAVLALREFKASRFGGDALPGPATRLTVEVRTPATSHELTVKRLENWLSASPKSPREQAVKIRLRELLSG
jgi:hypothetical protein